VDVYDPSLGSEQVHDLNPGIRQNGLFWTTVVAASSVDVDLAAGTAQLTLADVHLKDYHDIPNALGLVENGPQPVPATLSFAVRWSLSGETVHFDNAGQQFRGDFRVSADPAAAQMEWSAQIGGFDFRSAPLSTSGSSYAQLGREQNGSFY
jgi:hypothetical protein